MKNIFSRVHYWDVETHHVTLHVGGQFYLMHSTKGFKLEHGNLVIGLH